MVAVLMQTPPIIVRRSTIATRWPSFAAAIAARCRPGPLPTTSRSESWATTGLPPPAPSLASYTCTEPHSWRARWGGGPRTAGVRAARPPQAQAALRPAAGAGGRAALVGGPAWAPLRPAPGPPRDRRRRPRPGPPDLRGRRQVGRRHRLVAGRGLHPEAVVVHPPRTGRVHPVRADPDRP